MRIRRRVATTTAAVLAAAVLSACSGESESPPSPAAADTSTIEATTSASDLAEEKKAEATSAPSEDLDEAFTGPTLTVQVDEDRIRPNAAEVDIERGEKLTIRVTTDRAVELHAHSAPEQFLAFEAGRSSQRVRFQRAGVVEIEEHDSGQVLALVTVR